MTAADSDEVTRRFWGDAATGRKSGEVPVHWLGSPVVLRHVVNPRISGQPNVDWLGWIRHEFLPRKMASGFVLGCGGGALERRAAALGICDSFHGVDISPDAIAVARELARREGWTGFTYQALDANNLTLQPESLDLILSDMALHHITRLESVLEQFRGALRPGGVLVLNEFVGPDRFQWTDAQLKLATKAIRSLPLRYRRNRDLVRWKRYAKPWVFRAKRWSPDRVARMDPSESVRSSEIPSLVASRFRVVRRIDYGGTLLALVLNNIVGNFSDSSEDLRHLRSLAELEEQALESNRFSSDYVLMVAER